jgi:hypothetical protein
MIIVRNPTWFHWIVARPRGIKFNEDDYISHIVDPLAEWGRNRVEGSDRRLDVHADNARPQIAKKVTEFLAGNDMKLLPHPPG